MSRKMWFINFGLVVLFFLDFWYVVNLVSLDGFISFRKVWLKLSIGMWKQKFIPFLFFFLLLAAAWHVIYTLYWKVVECISGCGLCVPVSVLELVKIRFLFEWFFKKKNKVGCTKDVQAALACALTVGTTEVSSPKVLICFFRTRPFGNYNSIRGSFNFGLNVLSDMVACWRCP